MSFFNADSFVFNGRNSENYNLIICWIDSEINVATNGLHRTIQSGNVNQVRMNANCYGVEDSECITFEFNLIKKDGEEISRSESIQINEWLLSSTTPKLLFFNDNDITLNYYAICTTIEDVIYGGKLIGKYVKFETNSPYAFLPNIKRKYDISGEAIINIIVHSDTIKKAYYPKFTIETSENIIILENIEDKKSVTFDFTNFESNENMKIINVDCRKMMVTDKNRKLINVNKIGWGNDYISPITSSEEIENISYIYWLRFLNGENHIKIIGTCTLTVEYELPRKAGCL